MASDAEIKIFGKPADPEAVWDLAVSAAAEGKINWLHSFKISEFSGLLEQAAQEGRALTFTARCSTDVFEDTRSACQAAGLSYVVSQGNPGMEGFTNGLAWHPGMSDEYRFLLDGKHAVLRIADVQKAARQGIEAVNALVDRVATHAHVGKIELEAGFTEAYQAFAGEGDLQDGLSSSPRP
jgi:hypothetical protein